MNVSDKKCLLKTVIAKEGSKRIHQEKEQSPTHTYTRDKRDARKFPGYCPRLKYYSINIKKIKKLVRIMIIISKRKMINYW